MRKKKVVTITAGGRDKGRSYLLTEMPVMKCEKWAARLLLAMGRSGIEIPDDAIAAGAVGVLAVGVANIGKIAFEDAEPLLDEMMGCIAFVPDATAKDLVDPDWPVTRALMADDIDELPTLLKLRAEVAELHVGFSIPAALSDLAARWVASRQQNSSTSPKPAEPSSQQVEPA